MTIRTNLRLLIVVFFGFLLTSCDEASENISEGNLQRAEELHVSGNHRGAIIELKNLLKNNPKSPEARLLLAKIYVGVGDGASAEKEARQALELGAKNTDVFTTLGKSLILQNKSKQILDEITAPDDAPAALIAVVQLMHGEAKNKSGDLDAAETNFQNALIAYRKDINEDRPHLKLTEPAELIDALVGLVKISIKRENFDEAKERLETALQIDSKSPEVLATKGALDFQLKNFSAAEESYKAAFAARPYNARYQIQIAWAQIAQKKFDEANENLNTVLKAFPNHILSNYLRAVSAYQLQDYETVKARTDNVFRVNANHVPSFMLAGAASYALGQLEQANRYLSQYLSAVPDNKNARKLLSAAQLKLGRASDAMATLRPITEASSNDISLLSMIGTTAVASGDLKTGYKYLTKATEANPGDSRMKARAAIVQIAMGGKEKGLQDLEDAVGSDSGLKDLEARLILTYISEKKYEKAIEAAQRFQKRNPKEPLGFNLEGLAHFSQDNLAAASESFKAAINVRPGDPSASHNLALLYMKEGKIDLAKSTYNAVFQHYPDHTTTLLRLARVERRTNNQSGALDLLHRVLAVDPKSIPAKVRIARILIETGNPGKGLALAQDGLRDAPDDLALLETVGVAQLATSRPKDAVLTFTRLVDLSPQSVDAQWNLARAAFLSGNAPRANKALDMVLQSKPKHQDSLVLRIQIALLEGKFDVAKRFLATLKEIEGTATEVTLTEAKIALGEGKPEQAIEAFKKLTELREDTLDVQQLSELYWLRGRRPEAIAAMQKWLKKYPNDHLSGFKLAQFHMMAAQWTEAKPVLEYIVEKAPDYLAAVNNLAFVLYQIGDLDAALPYAKQANKLAPGDPVAMDTLGVILLAKGNAGEAVTLLRRAAARPSDSVATIRYHLAKALADSNQTDEAVKILTELMNGKRRFDEFDDAKALLEKLSK